MNKIFERLNEELDRRVINKSKMAEELNITRSTLYRMLNGESSIKVEHLAEIAERYGIDSDYVVTGKQRVKYEPVKRGNVRSTMGDLGDNETVKNLLVSRRYYKISGDDLIESEVELHFTKEYLEKYVKDFRDATLVKAPTNSMAPLILKNNDVLIDTSTSPIEFNSVYLLKFTGFLDFRYIHPLPNNKLKISTSNDYGNSKSFEIENDRNLYEIIGKAVWSAGSLKIE